MAHLGFPNNDSQYIILHRLQTKNTDKKLQQIFLFVSAKHFFSCSTLSRLVGHTFNMQWARSGAAWNSLTACLSAWNTPNVAWHSGYRHKMMWRAEEDLHWLALWVCSFARVFLVRIAFLCPTRYAFSSLNSLCLQGRFNRPTSLPRYFSVSLSHSWLEAGHDSVKLLPLVSGQFFCVWLPV